MKTYFKAVRPDGGSFNDPSFKWGLNPGDITKHPGGNMAETDGNDLRTNAAFYLSVATVATDCTGFRWPCRLLALAPVGRTWEPDKEHLPNKRAGLAFRTVRELDAVDVFGPQGAHVAALIDRAGRLTATEAKNLSAAWSTAWYAAGYAAGDAARDAAGYAALDAARDAARYAAGYAAGYAALDAARDAARYAARYAARDAAGALVVRDLISTEHYDTLTRPWRTAVGRIHPDDVDLREGK